MSNSTKNLSHKDANQVLKAVYNSADQSLTTNGFLVGAVGNKVTVAISTTTVTNDTETYSFYELSNLLYSIKIIYTDATKAQMLSAERVA